MKKSLVALAALAATTAFAQTATVRGGSGSSVEIFGVLDATVTRLTVENGGSVTIMDGGGRNASSRLGFRGVEDLGGGLSAAFWLEAAINVDNGTGSNSTLNNTSAGDRIAYNTSGANVLATQGTIGGRQGLTFNRASTVSLISKTFGELRLGRDYNPSFWNYTLFDPFGTVGAGSALNVIGGPLAPAGVQAFPPGAAYPMVRTSNSIGWLSQNMNGFRAQVQMGLAEQPTLCATPLANSNTNTCWGAKDDGKVVGLRLSYAQGKLAAAFGHSKTTYGDVASSGLGIATTAAGSAATVTAVSASLASTAATRGDFTASNLGGSYDFGVARVMVQYGTQETSASGAASARKLTHQMIGAVIPMGALSLKASYNTAKRTDAAGTAAEIGSETKQIAVGAQYDLSKRTALYTTYSRNSLTAGATTAGALRANLGLAGAALSAGQSATATGLDVGIRHSF